MGHHKHKDQTPTHRWVEPDEPWPGEENYVEAPQTSTEATSWPATWQPALPLPTSGPNHLAFARTELGRAVAYRDGAKPWLLQATQQPELAAACRHHLLVSCSRLRSLGAEMEVGRTLFLLAQLDLLQGDAREGQAALQLCLSYPLPNPERAEIYFALAQAALQQGNLTEAQSLFAQFEQLCDRYSPVQQVYRVVVQAERMVAEGRTQAALALVRQRYYQASDLPERTLYLRCAARLLSSLGCYVEAAWLFAYALGLDASSPRPPATMRLLILHQDLVAEHYCQERLATITPRPPALPSDRTGQELLLNLALSRR